MARGKQPPFSAERRRGRCGRFTLSSSPAAVAESLALPGLFDTPPLLQPRYNIAPSQSVAAVRADTEGILGLVTFRRGLVPS